MNDLKIFLNTRVENSGKWAEVGDKCLTPVRYLFSGQTFSIKDNIMLSGGNKTSLVSSQLSFPSPSGLQKLHKQPAKKKTLYTALAIVFLLPGLVGVAFKAASYLSADVRVHHRLIREKLIPQPLLQQFPLGCN